jgi:hypothetical protein
VMEKGKWLFIPRNQSSREESHISKCQSLLDQVQSDLEITNEKWSYSSKYPKSQCQSKTRCGNPHKSQKRNEVATISIVEAQVEEIYFIFILECRHAALSREMLRRS